MAITEDNFLDLGHLLLNELFGDVVLLIIVGLVFIVYYSVRSGMPFQVSLAGVLLFGGLVTAWVYNAFLWVLLLFVLGLLIYGLWAKVIKSNL